MKEFESFNSMKVRLKLAALATYLCTTLFQFHEGPIKTRKAYIYL